MQLAVPLRLQAKTEWLLCCRHDIDFFTTANIDGHMDSEGRILLLLMDSLSLYMLSACSHHVCIIWVPCCCRHDIDFFTTANIDGHTDSEVRSRLELVAKSGFHRMSYTEAIELLEKAVKDFKPGDPGGFSPKGKNAKSERLFEFEVGSTDSSVHMLLQKCYLCTMSIAR